MVGWKHGRVAASTGVLTIYLFLKMFAVLSHVVFFHESCPCHQ